MAEVSLGQTIGPAVVLMGAAVVAVPLFRRLGLFKDKASLLEGEYRKLPSARVVGAQEAMEFRYRSYRASSW